MAAPDSEHELTTTHDILVMSARPGLELQREDGSFPPGRNYTYDEPETPVRTTSHWLQTLTKAYEITEDPRFENAANLAVDYLLSDGVRPSGFTYHCRNVESKDKCNGLVGQAAPIRALAQASRVFNRQDARATAEEVFELHPFSEGLGLWERVEIDGSTLSFDRTLNHQIIFAAAAAELAVAEESIRQFLDELVTNMRLHSDGLIKHYVRPQFIDVLREVGSAPQRRYDMVVNEAVFHYYSLSKERRKKERGYQTVNLEALSRLHVVFPDHPFWDSEKLSSAMEFLRNNEQELVAGINTKHGDLLQGISIAKIYGEFDQISKEQQKRFITQELSTDIGSVDNVITVDSVDENTQTALVSRLTDLPNVEIR